MTTFLPTLRKPNHMPFLTEVDGKRVLLFCTTDSEYEVKLDPHAEPPKHIYHAEKTVRTGYRKDRNAFVFCNWQVHWCCLDDNPLNIKRLETGHSCRSTECSPAHYEKDGKHYVSYIAADHADGLAMLCLYEIEIDFANNRAGKPRLLIEGTRCGYSNRHHVAFSGGANFAVHSRDNLSKLHFTTDFTYIRRMCYLPQDIAKMLITGDTQEKIERTILFDLQTGQTQEVTTADDEPVYKSCLLNGEVIHTKQTGPDLDDRILVSDIPKFRETNIRVIPLVCNWMTQPTGPAR